MTIRFRVQELLMVAVAALLAADATLVDWYRTADATVTGLGSGVAGWLVLLLAVIALTAFAQTAMRRAATGGLAAEVSLFLLCPFATLVLLVACIFPSVFGPDGAETASGTWLGLAGCAALMLLTVSALRNDSRGMRPDPPAPVELLDLPADPTGSGGG